MIDKEARMDKGRQICHRSLKLHEAVDMGIDYGIEISKPQPNQPSRLLTDEIKAVFEREPVMEKLHWLFGTNRRVQILTETKCGGCIHGTVCDHRMESRCANYWFGTSAETGCSSCTNRFARYDKDKVPCFYCPYFVAKDEARIEALMKKGCGGVGSPCYYKKCPLKATLCKGEER